MPISSVELFATMHVKVSKSNTQHVSITSLLIYISLDSQGMVNLSLISALKVKPFKVTALQSGMVEKSICTVTMQNIYYRNLIKVITYKYSRLPGC